MPVQKLDIRYINKNVSRSYNLRAALEFSYGIQNQPDKDIRTQDPYIIKEGVQSCLRRNKIGNNKLK